MAQSHRQSFVSKNHQIDTFWLKFSPSRNHNTTMIYIQLLNWNGNMYTTLLWMQHLTKCRFFFLKIQSNLNKQTTQNARSGLNTVKNTLTSETSEANQWRNCYYKHTDKPTQQSQYTSISWNSHVKKWRHWTVIFKPEKFPIFFGPLARAAGKTKIFWAKQMFNKMCIYSRAGYSIFITLWH